MSGTSNNRFVAALLGAVMLLLPASAFAAQSVSSVMRDTAGYIRPLLLTDFVKAVYFTATSTTNHSTFPYATTTVTSAGFFCLTGDTCISAWPTGGGSAFPFTPVPTIGAQAANSTSTLIQFTQGIYANASSTIGNGTTIGGLTVSGSATTTGELVAGANAFKVGPTGAIINLLNGAVTISANALQMNSSGSDLLVQNNVSAAASGVKIQAASGKNFDITSGIKFFSGSTEWARIDGTGHLGLATTSPWGLLTVSDNTWASSTMPFLISSSTASATTTLFSVDNTGLASTTNFISSLGATTTVLNVLTVASTTRLYVSNAPNALALMGVDGLLGKYGGSSGVCTNQFPTSLSAVGALGTCTSVADAFFSGQLGVAHGGTNIGSYTAGDMLYASQPTVLTRIASTTSGTVLSLQNGIPTWVSTTTFSSPLTYSNGAAGIQAASASQAGSMAAVDFQLLHTATTTFTSPLIYTNATNAVTCQVATASVPGCLAAADFTIFNAKSSFGFPWTFALKANFGTSSLATTTSIATQGVFFASSTLAASQFPYASTTALSAGNLFTTGFAAFGTTTPGTMLSVSGSGVVSGPLSAASYSATSTLTPSIFPYASTTAMTGTYASSTFAFFHSVGVASSTPWASFSIQSDNSAIPAFAISGTTTSAFASSSIFQIAARGQVTACETRYGTAGNPATSTSMTIDWQNTCPTINLWMNTSAFTVNIINATTSASIGGHKIIDVCNPTTGTVGAITWTGVEWYGATQPTQTTTAGACDSWSLRTSSATSSMSVPAYKVVGAQSANLP